MSVSTKRKITRKDLQCLSIRGGQIMNSLDSPSEKWTLQRAAKVPGFRLPGNLHRSSNNDNKIPKIFHKYLDILSGFLLSGLIGIIH